MKLYIPTIDIKNITYNNLEKFKVLHDDVVEMYSDEGVYVSKNNSGFKKLDIIDGDIKMIRNYTSNHNLIIDESFVFKSKEYVSRLPKSHHIMKIQKREYKMSPKSPITLVIEVHDKVVTNIYFMMTEKHGKYSLPDINNQFTKETIDEFIKLM